MKYAFSGLIGVLALAMGVAMGLVEDRIQELPGSKP